QYRQAYDLFGTAFGDLVDSPEDHALVDLVRRIDARALGEASGLYSISRNVSERLRRHNELTARPLYPPPHLGERYRCDGWGDYLFTVGRLDRTKRFDLLVRLVAAAR